jgi:hypothetical protein
MPLNISIHDFYTPVSPPRLPDLRNALCEGLDSVAKMLTQIEGVGFIRARIEHRFSNSGLRAFTLYHPTRQVNPYLEVYVRAAFVLLEVRAIMRHGFGSVYKDHSRLPERLENAMAKADLARARYMEPLWAWVNDERRECKCMKRCRANDVRTQDTEPPRRVYHAEDPNVRRARQDLRQQVALRRSDAAAQRLRALLGGP